MARGLLITVEGIEGAGKGTAIKWSKRYLAHYDLPVVWSREPGGTALGEELRQILLNVNGQFAIGQEAELLICFAARAQHLEEVIRPALAEGKIVVCDRFTDSSYAYQGYARGGDLDKIATLEQLVQGELRPDFTLFLDISVEIGLSRIRAHRKSLDRIERERRDFFERAAEGYRAMAKQNSERYWVVNANCSYSELQRQLKLFWQRVIRCFKNENGFANDQ